MCVYNALAKGIVFILERWGGILKHLIHRKRSPFSFSGDANPFVLADISPIRGIASKGKAGEGLKVKAN